MARKADYTDFGERLKSVMDSNNLSHEAFCERVNVAKGTLSAYLTGKSQPKLDFLTVVVRDFELNANWLIAGEGEMFRSQGKFKEVSPDAFARGNVVVVETKRHGPVTLAVATIEQAHLAMDPDATEPEIMELILRSLDNRLKKIAPRYGSRMSAREPSGAIPMAHEAGVDYTDGSACKYLKDPPQLNNEDSNRTK